MYLSEKNPSKHINWLNWVQKLRKPSRRLLSDDRIIARLLISDRSVTNPALFPRFVTQPITHPLRLTKYYHLLVFPPQRLSTLHQFHRASKFSSLALEFTSKAIIPQNSLHQCLLLLCPPCKRGSADDTQLLDNKYQFCSSSHAKLNSRTVFQLFHSLWQQPAMGSFHWHPAWGKKGPRAQEWASLE